MQKFAHRLLGVLAGLCLCLSAGATTTVTGTLKTLGTGNITSGAFVRFYLRGCAGNQPRVNGTALIGPTVGAVFYFDVAADASGNISGTLYSTRDAAGTGNGDIECGGSKTGVWYGMQAFQGGRGGPEVPVHAKSGVSLDITSVTPITTNPVTTAPTGDTTYLRLDGGNAMTGGLAAPTYLSLTETSAPAAASGSDLIYGDSVAHRSKVKNNNGAADTLALFTDKLSVFAATTSAELASVLSDETGSGGGFVRATNPTVSAPVINGTPSGTGIPTFTAKSGTASGNYTTSSATYVDVDATNLSYTVTIPSGWKLACMATADGFNTTAAPGLGLRLVDGTTQIAGQVTNPPLVSSGTVSLTAVVAGDGNSHTIKLQFATMNAADAANLRNGNGGPGVTNTTPTMLFMLSPSN